MTAFDFEAFARTIFAETSGAHKEPFLLPALYGGAATGRYEVAFVLEAPSVSFTEKRWTRCHSPERAVQQHRHIFYEWAYRGKSAHLFAAMDRATRKDDSRQEADCAAFFRRFYVTDIWKDAAFRANKRQDYRSYWFGKLKVELAGIDTKRVVFVGREAASGLPCVPEGIPVHEVPFPGQWITVSDLDTQVFRLLAEMGASKEA